MNVLDLLVKTPEGEFRPKTDKGFVGLFVGASGSGKDCAQWSFPGPIYTFDIDNRIRGGLASIVWLGQDKLKEVDFDFYNPEDGFDAIDIKFESMLIEAKSRRLKYKTICVNSTSSLVYMLAISARRLRNSGRSVGRLKMVDPSDYNFMSMAFRQIQFLYAMPLAELGINVIFSGHLADKWVKPAPNEALGITVYSPAERAGQKLLGPAQLGEEIPGYFDEVYEFSRIELGQDNRYYAKFSGDFAKTSYPIKGEIDITGKSFYETWKTKVESSSFIGKK
jgi:hypothetical protein